MSKYKERTIICVNCGKESTKRRPEGQSFCSLECYRTSPKPERKTGKTGECGYCLKEIYIRPSSEKEVNYCSVSCFNKSQSRKTEHNCKVCGKLFLWSPSRTESGNYNPTYCSIECRTSCPDWKRKSVIAGNLAQQGKNAPTSLEIAGCLLLDALGIQYQTQVLICEKFVVDVFVPSKNLVIQWDGDYWHGFGGAKDERQKKRQRLDKSQDAYMRKAGYTVIRFWEHEVKNDKEVVRENIRKAVQ
jgi:DNA mismatch endonuclease (patch repair protein)